MRVECFERILTFMKFLMPNCKLPGSHYLFRKASRQVLAHVIGCSGFSRLHLCSEMECTHLYEDDSDECPLCKSPRYMVQQNGKRVPHRELMYLGLEHGVRVLAATREVGLAYASYDAEAAIDEPWSWLSSRLCERLCNHFIPGYRQMGEEMRRQAKYDFFTTGQVFTSREMRDRWIREVEDGTRNETLLFLVEAGCDGFQPFRRRVWSTWMYGYRIINVDVVGGGSSHSEIVVAISSGKSEGKAAQTVAGLEALQMKDLAPPSAMQRALDPNFAGLIEPARLRDVKMWRPDSEGKLRLKTVGVWVLCTGIQADAPMRAVLNKSLGATAERGCDTCGLKAERGRFNTCKYLGYSRPATVVVRAAQGDYVGEGEGWATGKVVKIGVADADVKTLSTKYTTQAVLQRDADLQLALVDLRGPNGDLVPSEEAKKAVYKLFGSKGTPEHIRAGLEWWDAIMHSPVAVYHTIYLGVGKDYLWYVAVRVGCDSQTLPPGEDLKLFFKRPNDVRHLFETRLGHFILRDKPDCNIVDWLSQRGKMSMHETMLIYEVLVPYLCHDLRDFMVPEEVVIMWLLLRHGAMRFTRAPVGATRQEYAEHLAEAEFAFVAFATIAEVCHLDKGLGANQFKFTWKLHQCCVHMKDDMLNSGHSLESSDMWVERLMRKRACRLLKNAITMAPELSIARSHQDNFGRVAMEVLVAEGMQEHAMELQSDHEEVPLLPTFDQLKALLLEQDKKPGARERAPVLDTPQEGEKTVFLGRGVVLKAGKHKAAANIKSAVGFFLFTQCADNIRGEWPHRTRALL